MTQTFEGYVIAPIKDVVDMPRKHVKWDHALV